MKITKYGHCCLLIETDSICLLTDPGSYSTVPEDLPKLDAILITHEHGDHIHIPALKQILAKQPNVRIITNTGVSKLLDGESIKYEKVEHKQQTKVGSVVVEGLGELHALMYKGFPQVQNTGYFIQNKLFYPGDALTLPQRPVDVLALPIVAPWLKLSEAIDYALAVKPRCCFPVHDGILKSPTMVHMIPSKVLHQAGIEFVSLDEGKFVEF